MNSFLLVGTNGIRCAGAAWDVRLHRAGGGVQMAAGSCGSGSSTRTVAPAGGCRPSTNGGLSTTRCAAASTTIPAAIPVLHPPRLHFPICLHPNPSISLFLPPPIFLVHRPSCTVYQSSSLLPPSPAPSYSLVLLLAKKLFPRMHRTTGTDPNCSWCTCILVALSLQLARSMIHGTTHSLLRPTLSLSIGRHR